MSHTEAVLNNINIVHEKLSAMIYYYLDFPDVLQTLLGAESISCFASSYGKMFEVSFFDL
jgi:hypothetical protein